MRNLLIIKSENFSPDQLQLLQQKGVATTHLNLLQFEYNNISVDKDYDCMKYLMKDILINSPNGAEAYLRTKHNNKKFMVVGQKTKEKLLSTLLVDNIAVFNNQQELTNQLLQQEDKLSLLYIVGNLSEISPELQQKHNVTIIEGYKTVPISKQIDIDFKCFDYIVYYSNSNYIQFKQIEKTLNPQALHIFIGQKCSAGNTEQNFKILVTPTFECLYELL